jgi:hypothetical protein
VEIAIAIKRCFLLFGQDVHRSVSAPTVFPVCVIPDLTM